MRANVKAMNYFAFESFKPFVAQKRLKIMKKNKLLESLPEIESFCSKESKTRETLGEGGCAQLCLS